MMCRSCFLAVILCAISVVPFLSAQETVDTAVNRSLYQENELWDGLMQNCGQKTTFSCVQSNIYGFLERSLQSDFYVTDGFFFKKNHNKYSEEMNLSDGLGSRESRSRWSKLNKSFGSDAGETPRDDTNQVEEEKVFAEMEKDDREEQESFSEFVKAVEEAEKTFDEKRKVPVPDPEVLTETTTFDTPTTVEEATTTPPATDAPDSAAPETSLPAKSISAVSDFMYSRGLGYFMTHDLELHLPSFVFGGAKITVSPRSFESDGGALLKFNIEPTAQPEGARTIHNIHKKIFHKKLMSSMLAALLIMKLIKVKLMFLLPVFLGVGTAKKILLKALLFIFPALAHLFKLCSYYHHKAKYHHHHHQIAHHHHHLPVSVPVYHGPPSHSSYHHSAGPPPGPVVSSDYGPPGPGYEVSGPAVEYAPERRVTEIPGTLSQHGNELASWGLGEFPASWEDPRVSRSGVPVTEPTRIHNYPPHRPQPGGFQYPENEVVDVKPPPPPPPGAYPHKSGFGGPPASGPDSFGPSGFGGPPTGPGRTGQAPPPSAPAATGAKSPVGAYSQAVHTRLQPLTPRPQTLTSSATSSNNVDPFYSPMLRKIDAVFIDMGVMDEGCRERLVCSMYKNPSKFSPHSNLMSAQLSKEPSELKKPTSMNPSVVRYFKYMQAARDGQEFKDCLRSYSSCNINTER